MQPRNHRTRHGCQPAIHPSWSKRVFLKFLPGGAQLCSRCIGILSHQAKFSHARIRMPLNAVNTNLWEEIACLNALSPIRPLNICNDFDCEKAGRIPANPELSDAAFNSALGWNCELNGVMFELLPRPPRFSPEDFIPVVRFACIAHNSLIGFVGSSLHANRGRKNHRCQAWAR